MKPTALVILAHGVEELECIAPVDILRRADVDVTLATVEEDAIVRGRNAIEIGSDVHLSEVAQQAFDLVFIPGGPGHQALRKDAQVLDIVRTQAQSGRLLAAICAGPTVLKSAGVLPEAYTAHPSVAEELPDIQENQAVVLCQNILTSRGAGTAVELGLAMVEQLRGPQPASEIARSICYTGLAGQ